MLGHDQTRGRRGRAWRVGRLLVVAVLPALVVAPAPAGEDRPRLRPSEEIRLSADRVQYWDAADGVRWVVLQGQGAALQEADGLRAEALVARIEKVSRQGQIGFEVQVHAEGKARATRADSRPIASRRATLDTTGKVTLTSFVSGGITKLDGPPADLAILARGFPDATAVVKADPQVGSDPREAVPEAALGGPLPIGEPEPTEGAGAIVEPPVTAATPAGTRDAEVHQAQGESDGPDGPPTLIDAEPGTVPSPEQDPGIQPPIEEGMTDLAPLPDGGEVPPADDPDAKLFIQAPLLPGTRRTFTISGGPNFSVENFETENGDITYVLRGGINLVANLPRNNGLPLPGILEPYSTVDISADNIVIWTRRSKTNPKARLDPRAGIQQDPDEPLQLYMEGNVRIRQDSREVAGKGDEKIFEAERAYYDLRTERLTALEGRVYTTTPGLLAPLRTDGKVINQYREVQGLTPKGKLLLGPQFVRLDGSSTTGSRFPVPGYRFNSQSIEIEDITVPLVDQSTGGTAGKGQGPAQQDKLFQFRAFNNAYFLGRIPVFYLPFTKFTSDFDPLLRNIRFTSGNVFGQQIQFDLSGFRLLGIRKPQHIDNWNIDIDYLSYRGFAAGSEIGWFGRDPMGDFLNPYTPDKSRRGVDLPYYGYLDLWGIHDTGRDNLGPGPAVITYGPPGLGRRGYQRDSVPLQQTFRGRVNARHMQRLLGIDSPDDEDLRFQLEAGYESDRHFLEEYYKRLFDSGMDQETLFYGIRQKQNRALTLQTEVNLQNWYTETQWLPKLEYTRLDDAFLNNWVNVSMRAGADYASTHTAIEVDNPNIFAFLPRDPVSNTSGVLNTGRIYTAGEVAVPLNLEFLKIVPYAQGQLVGWNNQIDYQTVGRAWGAFGARANILAWRTFDGPRYESELLNIHGLAHKINVQANFRSAYSNQPLNRIGVQDDLDDNSYEFTRRYFALTNYVGGRLPAQYDPRLLTLRRQVSPITGTTDIQDTIETLRMGIHQRLQTKRGPEGARRIIDYMTLDVDTTYFPNARRDNFGKPFGQNTYNYEWFIGDRTSFTSYGWFEFWDVAGQAIPAATPRHTNDPFGLTVITSGFSISRPPRGNVFIGYSIINTGPIATSALNLSYTYWMSPKWYMFFATSYDFGNAILLGSTVSITKITKDYLTSVGLTVDPQRSNYTFALELSPRFSPNVRFGSTAGTRFDSRFAPSQ